MSFADLEAVGLPPKRVCFGPPIGSVLRTFPSTPLPPEFGNGYLFRGEPCNTVADYSPNYCQPGSIKKDPDHYGPTKHAVVNVLQTAFECSPVGATDQDLRDQALGAIERNLWRAVDTTLNGMIALEAVSQGGPVSPICALSAAQQYLFEHSYCGNGIIMGPASWVNLLNTNHVNLSLTGGDIADVTAGKEPFFYRDLFGNYIILSAADTSTVYAFDSTVDIMESEPILLDQFMPGLREHNDRVVRAETVYTVAVDNSCNVGSWTLISCDDLNYLH